MRMEGKRISLDTPRNGKSKVLDPAFSAFLVQLPSKLQNCLKSQLKRLAKDGARIKPLNSSLEKKNGSSSGLQINLEKQLQAWRENPSWVNPPPEIEVSVAKGSLCYLKATIDVGLPPDAVYNIVTDPDNRRVFKNVKVSVLVSTTIINQKFCIMLQLPMLLLLFIFPKSPMFDKFSDVGTRI
ncbi:hypothetical protein ES319_A05G330400v1 [Gossypium barbadense]|uniref:Uncharacterized protein n=1 Tax=Gossypium barbadense TaxID=3634 RepID=A0A5J5VW38_GOSBA|nr:hypothetical protein ES319_A05G330400v1 [Gossypium barbadense]